MDHETFVSQARKAGENAQGYCSLAFHVRRLYRVIQDLLVEGNSYFYIAEVLLSVRGEKTDAAQMAERVRVYHFRDRRDIGDPPVKRRLVSSSKAETGVEAGGLPTGSFEGKAIVPENSPAELERPAGGKASGSPPPSSTDLPEAASSMWTIADRKGGTQDDPGMAPPTDAEREARRALTRSLHQRNGRRIVVRES